MFDLKPLLDPVSGADACGEDLSFSQDLDAIARARQHDDPTLEQGAWVAPLKEADWPFVGARCAALIASRSKDLRLAVWLAEAHAYTRHFRGLGDGYALLAGLCERYWEGLYPAPEEGDYEQRIGNLFWLLARSPQLVKSIPLTDGIDGAFSINDFDAARQRAAAALHATDSWGQPQSQPDTSATLVQMEAARQKNTRQFNQGLLDDASYCLNALLQLEQVVDARLGASGPSFRAAIDALEGALAVIRPLVALVAVLVPGAAPSGADGASASAAVTGAPRERAQALAQLRLVAEFFRRTEPHSPVAYLADKAASWGELPLHLWLRAVVKDQNALAQLDELLGADSPVE